MVIAGLVEPPLVADAQEWVGEVLERMGEHAFVVVLEGEAAVLLARQDLQGYPPDLPLREAFSLHRRTLLLPGDMELEEALRRLEEEGLEAALVRGPEGYGVLDRRRLRAHPPAAGPDVALVGEALAAVGKALSNPLLVIQGRAGVLQAEVPEEEQRRSLESIQGMARRLEQVARALLDMEQGPVEERSLEELLEGPLGIMREAFAEVPIQTEGLEGLRVRARAPAGPLRVGLLLMLLAIRRHLAEGAALRLRGRLEDGEPRLEVSGFEGTPRELWGLRAPLERLGVELRLQPSQATVRFP